MKSPITESDNVTLESKISVSEIVDRYKADFKIDVQKYFSDEESICVYKCNESGYRFYYPFNTAGDSDFYMHFQQFDWYYMPWKWEHDMCSRFIQPHHKILEVGCGEGAFLKKIHQINGNVCVGLELNEGVTIESDDLKIKNLKIEDYSLECKEQFDIVCSFQVLEHIPLVNSFIKSQIDCLKRNGLLVICVPNNDSFIKYEQFILNMPPHHMGLWNENSLKSLQNYFNIRVKQILFEPLQSYHFDFYTGTMVKRYFGNLSNIMMVFLKKSKLINVVRKYLSKRVDLIKGHSIMIVFEKI